MRLANDLTLEVVTMNGVDATLVRPVENLTERMRAEGMRARHYSMGRPRASRTTRERLETTYLPRRASAAEMRTDLRALLAEHALDAAVACQVVLAAVEAFINAVTHGRGAGDAIHVSARVSKTEAAVEVRDGGDGFTLRRSDPRSVPDVHCPTGRGVFLIESMMDEVSVRSGRDGTTVRMVRHLT
jgi:anti-sigma regulatory factor (Ser/Thr protein kinase)